MRNQEAFKLCKSGKFLINLNSKSFKDLSWDFGPM